jgi:hypothetical protein
MTRRSRDDLRSEALDAYLVRREDDGYQVETRTAVQAVIVRRDPWYSARRLARTSGADRRLVVSVDEHGEVSAVAAEPLRW